MLPIVEVSSDDWVRRLEIVELLKQGGEVEMAFAESGLARARRIVAVLDEDRIVAVGAIKLPTPKYIIGLAHKSGTDLQGFDRELGYMATATSHQRLGLAGRITAALTDQEHQLFASTNNRNGPMQRILTRFGFQRIGKSWPSSQNPRTTVSLWVRKVG